MTAPLPTVFVTGASGFIGEEVALGFRRAGHRVYGLVRSPEKAAWLAYNEITPVVGDLLKPLTYVEELKKSKIVVHCASDYSNYSAVDGTAVRTILTTLSSVSTAHDPALVIFTSGILVYKGMKSASDPPIEEDSAELEEDAPGILGERVHNERIILRAHESTEGKVAGVVVRPAFVYGRKSGQFYHYFNQAIDDNEVVVKGDPSITWSEVHIDDLVAGYLLIASASHAKMAGQAFHFVDNAHNTNLEIAQAFAHAAGFEGQVKVEPLNEPTWSQKTVICSGKKTAEVLGWTPQKEMLAEIDVVWERWRAAKRVEFVVKK